MTLNRAQATLRLGEVVVKAEEGREIEDIILVVEEIIAAAVFTLSSVGSISIPSPAPPLSPSPTSPARQKEKEAEVLLPMFLVTLTVLLDRLLRLVSCAWCGFA